MSISRARCLFSLVLAALLLAACGGDENEGGNDDSPVYSGAKTGERQAGFQVLAGQTAEMSISGDFEKLFGSSPVVKIEDADKGEWEFKDGYYTDDAVQDVQAWYENKLSDKWKKHTYDNNRGGGYVFAKDDTRILITSDSEGTTWILFVTQK